MVRKIKDSGYLFIEKIMGQEEDLQWGNNEKRKKKIPAMECTVISFFRSSVDRIPHKYGKGLL